MPNPTGEQAARELSVKIAQQQAASEQLKAEAAKQSADNELSSGMKTIFGAVQGTSQLAGAASDLWKTSMQEDLYEAQAAKLKADTKIARSNAYQQRLENHRNSIKYYEGLGLEPHEALGRHREFILGRMKVLAQMKDKNPDSWNDDPLSMDEESLREMLVMAGGEEGALANVFGPLRSTVLTRAVKAGAEYKAMVDQYVAEKELQLLQMKKEMGYEIDYPLEKFKEFQHMLADPDLREYALGLLNANLKVWYELQLKKGKQPITRQNPGVKGPPGSQGAPGQPNAQVMPSAGVLQAMNMPEFFKGLEAAMKSAGRRTGLKKIKEMGRSEQWTAANENEAFVKSFYGPGFGSKVMNSEEYTVKAIADPDGVNELGLRNATGQYVIQGFGQGLATRESGKRIAQKGGWAAYLLALQGTEEQTVWDPKTRKNVTVPAVGPTQETLAGIGAAASYGGNEAQLQHNIKSHTLQPELAGAMSGLLIDGKADGPLAKAVGLAGYGFTGELSKQSSPVNWLTEVLNSKTNIGRTGNDFMEQFILAHMTQKSIDMNPGNIDGFTQGILKHNYATGSASVNGHGKAEREALVAVARAWLNNEHGAAKRWSPELIEGAGKFIDEWSQVSSGVHPSNITSSVSGKHLDAARARMMHRWSYRQLEHANQLKHFQGYYDKVEDLRGDSNTAKPIGSIAARQKTDNIIRKYELFAAIRDLKNQKAKIEAQISYFDPMTGEIVKGSRSDRREGFDLSGGMGADDYGPNTPSGKALNAIDYNIGRFEDHLEKYYGGLTEEELLKTVGSAGIQKLENLRRESIKKFGGKMTTRGYSLLEKLFGFRSLESRSYSEEDLKDFYFGDDIGVLQRDYKYEYPKLGFDAGSYEPLPDAHGFFATKTPRGAEANIGDMQRAYNRAAAIEELLPSVTLGLQTAAGAVAGASPKYTGDRGETAAYDETAAFMHGVPPFVYKQVDDLSRNNNFKNPLYGKPKEIHLGIKALKNDEYRNLLQQRFGQPVHAPTEEELEAVKGDPSKGRTLSVPFGTGTGKTATADPVKLDTPAGPPSPGTPKEGGAQQTGPSRTKPYYKEGQEESLREAGELPPKPGEEQGSVQPMHQMNTREEIYQGHLDAETIAQLPSKELNNMGDSALLALHMTLGEFEEQPNNRFIQLLLDNQISEWGEFLSQAGGFVPSNALTEYIGEDWSPMAFRERAVGIGHGDIRSRILGDRLNGLRTA